MIDPRPGDPLSFMRFRPARAVLAACALVAAMTATAAVADDTTFVSPPVAPGEFRGDVRDLPRPPVWRPGDPRVEGPRRRITHRAMTPARAPGAVDPLLSQQTSTRSASRVFTTTDVNVAGVGDSGVMPPDPIGAIGPSHYVQAVNAISGTTILILDKTTGATAATFTLDNMWPTAGACRTGEGDPSVLFDQIAQRWLLAEFAKTGNHLCVYISKSSDPVSGGWWTYDFVTPQFPDYPKFAVWPDAYYATTNESHPAVYAFDRSAMLTGAAATFQRKTGTDLAGFGFQAFTPADVDGFGVPPAGSPAFMLRHRDDEVHNAGSNNPAEDYVEVWGFSVDFVTPANTAFTKLADVAVAEFDSDLCGVSSFQCIPQRNTTQTLDPLREIIMNRVQYRNFGAHQTLVGSFVTDVSGTDHAGVRWFELRRAGLGAWSLYQEGTYAPDANHRWNSSIAMDGSGNIALGYSVSSTSTYPGIRYVGRKSGDTLGTMTTVETTMRAGAGSQSAERWGDYSAMTVDPTDNCRFWYTNEYILASGDWATRVASFRFDAPDCVDSSSATCGNNVQEAGEDCDGTDDAACPGLCNGSCACPAPVCGNNIIESGEQCDGTSAGSCPTGTCAGGCVCPAPVCGNNITENGEDCDGTDDAACPGACDGSCVCPVTCDGTDLYIPSATADAVNYRWKIEVDNADGAYNGADPRNGFTLVVNQGATTITTDISPTAGWDRSRPTSGKYIWLGDVDGVTKVTMIDKTATLGILRVKVRGKYVPGAGSLDIVTSYANVELTIDGHCGGGVY